MFGFVECKVVLYPFTKDNQALLYYYQRKDQKNIEIMMMMMAMMAMLLMMGVCTDSVKVAAKTSPTFLICWMRGGGG